ncbi:oligoendopeptidase [Streptomyces sp. NBRC 110611]|nr:oligoendopeptidase [Streptomyces sp. NBRC 110611]
MGDGGVTGVRVERWGGAGGTAGGADGAVPGRSDAREAGLEVPDGGVVGEAVVHVGEVGDQVVQEIAGLAA